MRRLVSTAVLLLLLGAGALVASSVAQGGNNYTFDVIFDDARGLIPGQEVKIAGAKAGAINKVVVTSDDKARVEAQLSGPFQFHTDATCTIRPDGLIAENYLDCDPGTLTKPLLAASGGYPPTVPVTQTTEPVTLQDLFDIFNVPTSERFQTLIDELGIATAGQGDDINAILQRANPTLKLAQNVIDILDRQTAQISTAIDATDTIARTGATHTAAVKNFLTRAAALTALTANHSSTLEQAINRLPGLLSAAQPALAQLNTVAVDGTPLLANLRKSVPALNAVNRDIVPFARIAQPGLASLANVVDTAIPTGTAVTPLVKTIQNYLTASQPTGKQFSTLLTNLIQHGFSESLMSVFYYVAGALSKYDSNSHMLSGLLVFPDDGGCAMYATTPSSSAECQGHYVLQGAAATADRAPATKAPASKAGAKQPTSAAGTSAAPATTSAAASPTASTPAPSGLGTGLSNLGSTLAGTVNKVLAGVGGAGKAAGAAGSGTSTANQSQTSTTSTPTSTAQLQNLLNYLLK